MIDYNLQFEKLCTLLNLGEIIYKPQTLLGGHMHKMFAIQTTKGKYAIKALNPQVMLRPLAIQNIIDSEKIANIVAKNISAIPAKIYNNKSIQELDGQYYLIFDWCNGESIFGNEITTEHCVKMGEILGKLHTTDFSKLNLVNNNIVDEPIPDWNSYLQQGKQCNKAWVDIVSENIDKLYKWSNELYYASKILSTNFVITHADLEPKNVIWNNNEAFIIDWEAAGFLNQMHDLIETAMYWTKDIKVDKNKFLAFIYGYKSIIQNIKADWDIVLSKGFSLLGWLEYSFKRSLWIECTDETENVMGTEHVTGTINMLLQYEKEIPNLKQWLNSIY